MRGSLFINSKDAYINWGVVLQKGAFDSILLPPNNKAYTTNEQRSSSGVQVFYENTQPMDRDFNISFVILANNQSDYNTKYNSFINELNSGELKMRISGLKMEMNVYINGYLSLNRFRNGKGILNVRFNEPNIKERIYL